MVIGNVINLVSFVDIEIKFMFKCNKNDNILIGKGLKISFFCLEIFYFYYLGNIYWVLCV